ncbi:MAG TPA: serine hydrolase domain-containing protein [bacterium]|nr:serine hydrolase domain-containing protein [bacterium]
MRKKIYFVDKIIKEGIDKKIIPGAVLLVGNKNDIIYWKAYGNREITPEKIKMGKNTIFDLASITKPVATATSIMILVEESKISVNDKVIKYIPEFGKNGKKEITIKMLLTHYSGLSNQKFHNTPTKILERICEETPIYKPDSEFNYSCLGYIILGKIVEIVSGKSLDVFTKEKIFEPLGMKDTMFNPPEKLWVRCAPTIYRDGKLLKGKVNDMQAYVMGGVAGNAGLFSTACDLSIFAQFILNEGIYNEVKVLNPEIVKTMISKASPLNKNEYGLGWNISAPNSFVKGSIPSGYSFGHTGWTGCSLWFYPEIDLFIIFLTNQNHPEEKPNGSFIAKQLNALVNDAILLNFVNC